jgi:hypothetical protein
MPGAVDGLVRASSRMPSSRYRGAIARNFDPAFQIFRHPRLGVLDPYSIEYPSPAGYAAMQQDNIICKYLTNKLLLTIETERQAIFH